MSEDSENTPKGVSRRTFLKLGIGALGAAALNTASSKIPEELRNPENNFANSNITVLDSFDFSGFKQIYLEKHFPDSFSEEEMFGEMGTNVPENLEELSQTRPNNIKQATLVMLKALELHYRKHGNSVVHSMENVSNYYNSDNHQSPETTSVLDAIRVGKVVEDRLGNLQMEISWSLEDMERLVEQTDDSVINLSLELGSTIIQYDMFYEADRGNHPLTPLSITARDTEGNVVSESTTYKDAEGNQISEEEYNELEALASQQIVKKMDHNRLTFQDFYWGDEGDEEKVYGNLKEMAKLAQKFPDKIFLAAGGNVFYYEGRTRQPDITSARERLEKEGLWPDNLIIVGYSGRVGAGIASYDGPASYGADIYIDRDYFEKFDIQPASSFATPMVSASVSELIKLGVNKPSSIKSFIFEFCDEISLPEDQMYRQFNIDLFRRFITKKKSDQK